MDINSQPDRPRFANSLAISLPIPAFAPVTITVLPAIRSLPTNFDPPARSLQSHNFNKLINNTWTVIFRFMYRFKK